MKIIFIRHGDTDWPLVDERNIRGWGRELAPLTQLGRIQIEAIVNDYRLADADAVLCSSYARALESAAILNRHLAKPFHVDYDLHEWLPQKNPLAELDSETAQRANQELMYYTGVLAFPDRRVSHKGKSYKGKERRTPFIERKMPAPEDRTWESLDEVRSRATDALKRYSHYSSIIVVAHAVLIAALVGVQRYINHAEIIACDFDLATGEIKKKQVRANLKADLAELYA